MNKYFYLLLIIILFVFIDSNPSWSGERYSFKKQGVDGRIPEGWVTRPGTLNETLIAARLPNGKVPRTNCWLQHYAFPELKSYSIDDLDNLRLRIESEGDVDSLLRESPMYRNADIQIKPHITLSGFQTSVLNSRVKIQNISAFGIHAITPTFTGLIVTGCNGREENKKEITSSFGVWVSNMFFKQYP